MAIFQDYIKKSTKKVLSILETAIAELVAQKQNVLTADFILLALISESDNEAIRIIDKLVADPKKAIEQVREQIYRHYEHATPVQANQIVGSKRIYKAAGWVRVTQGYISIGACNKQRCAHSLLR